MKNKIKVFAVTFSVLMLFSLKIKELIQKLKTVKLLQIQVFIK